MLTTGFDVMYGKGLNTNDRFVENQYPQWMKDENYQNCDDFFAMISPKKSRRRQVKRK